MDANKYFKGGPFLSTKKRREKDKTINFTIQKSLRTRLKDKKDYNEIIMQIVFGCLFFWQRFALHSFFFKLIPNFVNCMKFANDFLDFFRLFFCCVSLEQIIDISKMK